VQRAALPAAAAHHHRSPSARLPVVQCYLGQINKKTDKVFEFGDGTSSGRDAIFARSTDGTQTGYIRYSFHKDTCILEHIETDPENGTGLGPLLMNLLAKKALERGYKKIDVAMPRYPDYYARFGFQMQGKAYGTAATQTVITKTGEYVARDWMNPKFADVYLKDVKRSQANLPPVLSEFPRLDE
jgi:hypothetical protein